MINTTLVVRCLAVAWLLAVFCGAATLHAAERKPNFLFIYTDDQRWDALGVVQREQGEKARYVALAWASSVKETIAPPMSRLMTEE